MVYARLRLFGWSGLPSCWFAPVAIAAWLAMLGLGGCTNPSSSEGEARRHPSEVGIASWYGPGFHGKRTTSGAIYDQNGLTAAHRTLPLGSSVRVTNLQNRKSIDVVINDRGPFAKGRIIDLSYAAAKRVALIGPGTARVRVEVLDDGGHRLNRIPDRLKYTVQVGAFSEMANALELKKRLERRYNNVFIEKQGSYSRVRLGIFSSQAEAKHYAEDLARAGFNPLIVEKTVSNGES